MLGMRACLVSMVRDDCGLDTTQEGYLGLKSMEAVAGACHE